MSSVYIEANAQDKTRDLHRAMVSLQEELEAITYYAQRADAATDPDLKAVLLHNREEEIEHATMLYEWLRRQDPKFAQTARTYVGTKLPITEIEEADQGGNGAGAASKPGGGERPLAIGNLR